MVRSALLAKIIGPPFLAVGLGLLLNQKIYWDMIDEVIRHPTPIGNMLIYLSGVLSMLAGLGVVNTHPSWTRDWRVILTIVGWLLLVGGLVRIVLPGIILKLGSTLYGSPITLLIVAIISLGSVAYLASKDIGRPHKKSLQRPRGQHSGTYYYDKRNSGPGRAF